MTEFEDTKGVIRSRESKNRQYNGQKCKDTKGVIRSGISKNRQYNGQKCKDTKGVTISHKSMNTDNTMVKSVKIPMG